MPMVYGWKPGFHAPVPAQIAGEEISRIRVEQGKFFTPASVVQASRPNEAPLHRAFEWNDAKAAVAFREEQARYLVRHIVIVNEAEPQRKPMRAFVSVRDDDDQARFTTIAHAMSDAELREQVLAQARADMQTFEQKYGQLLDLTGVVQAFETARVRATASPATMAS